MLYKGADSPYWHYDFRWQGHRFYGSTKTASKTKARQVENLLRAEASNAGVRRPALTLDVACGRYFLEVAQHQASAGTTEYQLANLIEGLGTDITLAELDGNGVAIYAARRRATVSNASVNREIELLQRVLRRAERVWKADIGDMPDWRTLKFREPAERIRELSFEEEMRLFQNLRADFHPLVRFALLSGVRLGNLIDLTWSQVDFHNRRLVLKTKSKRPGGDNFVLPLTRPMAALMADQRGDHPTSVFTYVCQKSRAGRRKGRRYPFTRTGWRKAWKAALEAANIKDFRFHDLRHTAATRDSAGEQQPQGRAGHARPRGHRHDQPLRPCHDRGRACRHGAGHSPRENSRDRQVAVC